MQLTQSIITILSEILDLEPTAIHPETYLIRDLHAESIDLLEIGVAMQYHLDIIVDDDCLFLKNLRLILSRAEKQGLVAQDVLKAAYPQLAPHRLQDILSDLSPGPVVQVQDLVAYARHAQKDWV